MTLTVANKVKGLVADFEYNGVEVRWALRHPIIFTRGADATAETRSLKAPEAGRLATRGSESKGLARAGGTRSLETRGDGAGEEWELFAGYHCAPEAETCLYELYISENKDWNDLASPCQFQVEQRHKFEINRTPWSRCQVRPTG